MYVHLYAYQKENETKTIVDISITNEEINYILAKYKKFIYFFTFKNFNEDINLEKLENHISWILVHNKICECGFDLYEVSEECVVPTNIILKKNNNIIFRNSMFGSIQIKNINESKFMNVYPLTNETKFDKLPLILYEYLKVNTKNVQIINYENDPNIVIR